MSANLASAARLEAVRLAHHWIGAEHVLLASMANQEDVEFARALSSVGVTYGSAIEALSERVAREGPPVPQKSSVIVAIPSSHAAEAATKASADARGHVEATDTDALVGLLTLPPDESVGRLLADLGTTREAVANALRFESVDYMVGRETDHSVAYPLLKLAEGQGIERGYPYATESDVMLALLAGGPDPLARDVLSAAGVTHESFLAWDDERRAQWPPRGQPYARAAGVLADPAVWHLLSRAHGFASALGNGVIRSEHGLLGWLRQPWGQSVLALEQLSTTGDAVLGALSAAGVPVPRASLPEPTLPWGERIEVPMDRLNDVVAELTRQLYAGKLPPRSFGFNSYGGIGWVVARTNVDIRPTVSRVLAGHI